MKNSISDLIDNLDNMNVSKYQIDNNTAHIYNSEAITLRALSQAMWGSLQYQLKHVLQYHSDGLKKHNKSSFAGSDTHDEGIQSRQKDINNVCITIDQQRELFDIFSKLYRESTGETFRPLVKKADTASRKQTLAMQESEELLKKLENY